MNNLQEYSVTRSVIDDILKENDAKLADTVDSLSNFLLESSTLGTNNDAHLVPANILIATMYCLLSYFMICATNLKVKFMFILI